jgi:hypothetical protein
MNFVMNIIHKLNNLEKVFTKKDNELSSSLFEKLILKPFQISFYEEILLKLSKKEVNFGNTQSNKESFFKSFLI